MNDLRLAARQLAKTPGFTAVAILTLALGIGATTAIFSVVNTVLLRPLDYPAAREIVTVWNFYLGRNQRGTISGADFRDWQASSQSFAALAKYQGGETGVVLDGAAESTGTAAVSADFFSVFGIAPQAGRGFSADELSAGGAALVSDAYVQRKFGGSIERALAGRLRAYGRDFQIVGVLPPGFSFPNRTDVWLPVDTYFPMVASRTAHNYRAIGRLKPGVSVSQARKEMEGIAAQLAAQFPENKSKSVTLIPLQEFLVANHRGTLWTMLGAVALLLLIACANISNLLLARGATRSREIAVRTALGASPWQVVRTLLAESALLSAGAAGAGILLGWIGLRTLVALAPANIPRLDQVGLDLPTLACAVVLAGLVCLLAGVAPAVLSAKTDLTTALRSGGRGIAGGRGLFRSGLVVAQLAISLVLLAGAALLIRSFQLLTAVDPGYKTERVLVMDTAYPSSTRGAAEASTAFFQEITRQIAALPGVTAVSTTNTLPIDGPTSNGGYAVEGRPKPGPDDYLKQSAIWRSVGPGYFAALGIPLRSGREFDERDTASRPQTVIINESLARATWPNEDPLGHRIAIGWDTAEVVWMTIVGVVADTKQFSLDAATRAELFVAAPQHPLVSTRMKVVVRTAGEPMALAESLRKIVAAANAEVPVKFTTAEMLVGDTLAAPRFRALLISTFAGVALLLAVVGVAGVLACMVNERRTEIGIRMALGALPGMVVQDFVRRGGKLALLGLAIGLLAAFAAARFLQGMLFGVGAGDPIVFGLVAAGLLFAALAASAIPASRAAKVDPLVVLRAD
jgi:putative ABC transport system permease protein